MTMETPRQISDLTTPELENLLQKKGEIYHEAILEFYDRDTEFSSLDAFKKCVFNECKPGDGPEHIQNKVAETSDNYKNHIQAWVDAKKIYNQARGKMKAAEVKFEVVKTIFMKR